MIFKKEVRSRQSSNIFICILYCQQKKMGRTKQTMRMSASASDETLAEKAARLAKEQKKAKNAAKKLEAQEKRKIKGIARYGGSHRMSLRKKDSK
ncbi:unnamed protein product [Caenorhabditis angaria]|uniref:Uncharacterized protein n=1 Tax=Caenorhabditis angaria TaxID=860376 RepID=A0A9P1IY73_9PELO|nr:unnamed protein product [Caenorhabditis angaria]